MMIDRSISLHACAIDDYAAPAETLEHLNISYVSRWSISSWSESGISYRYAIVSLWPHSYYYIQSLFCRTQVCI